MPIDIESNSVVRYPKIVTKALRILGSGSEVMDQEKTYHRSGSRGPRKAPDQDPQHWYIPYSICFDGELSTRHLIHSFRSVWCPRTVIGGLNTSPFFQQEKLLTSAMLRYHTCILVSNLESLCPYTVTVFISYPVFVILNLNCTVRHVF